MIAQPIQQTRWILFGAPDCPRIAQFARRIHSCGNVPVTVSYIDVLLRPQWVLQKLTAVAGQINYVRLETPGTHLELRHLLINRGANSLDDQAVQWKEVVVLEPCRLAHLQGWYEGFKHLLDCIETLLSQLRQITKCQTRYLSAPSDIAAMFDKTDTLSRMRAQGVATPAFLGQIDNYEQLCATMQDKNINQVFVKPNYSASAAGIIALKYHSARRRAIAVTPIEYVDQGGAKYFYNTRRLQQYTDEKTIEHIVDYVAANKAYAERWLPKSQYQGMSFDVRVIVVNGMAVQAVARLSRQPITNLHLGNQRMPLQAMQIDSAHKQRYVEVAQQAMAAFPGALYAGVDVLMPLRAQQAMVLEVNAFGDYIKDDGEIAPVECNSPANTRAVSDIYSAQITAMAEPFRSELAFYAH